ncbi:MAG: hypothetical protein K2N60_12925 [Oscillospiraceae bacterium]|nr:hypothetical protein [Oscillospiraceae bacterium]
MTKISDFMKKYYHLLAATIVTLFIAFVICAFFVEAVGYAMVVLLYFICNNLGLFLLFMFLIMFITASLNLGMPLKPLVIANHSVSIAASIVLIGIPQLLDYDFPGEIINYYLILFSFLIIVLPNLILYIKTRKQQGKYNFAENIISAIILFVCHIPTGATILWYIINWLFVYF